MLKAISTPLDGVLVSYGWTPLGMSNHKKTLFERGGFSWLDT